MSSMPTCALGLCSAGSAQQTSTGAGGVFAPVGPWLPSVTSGAPNVVSTTAQPSSAPPTALAPPPPKSSAASSAAAGALPIPVIAPLPKAPGIAPPPGLPDLPEPGKQIHVSQSKLPMMLLRGERADHRYRQQRQTTITTTACTEACRTAQIRCFDLRLESMYQVHHGCSLYYVTALLSRCVVDYIDINQHEL